MRRGHTDNGTRAVSPVIGVILMVAITVVLAATAAAFVIGLGNDQSSDRPPTAGFDYRYDTEEIPGGTTGTQILRLTHRGGDPIEPSNLDIVVTGATCGNGQDPNGRYDPEDLYNSDSKISAGSSMVLEEDELCQAPTSNVVLDLSEAEVSIVWESPSESKSQTLWRWQGPQVS